jgi:histidinol-phosphate aminotransferase
MGVPWSVPRSDEIAAWHATRAAVRDTRVPRSVRPPVLAPRYHTRRAAERDTGVPANVTMERTTPRYHTGRSVERSKPTRPTVVTPSLYTNLVRPDLASIAPVVHGSVAAAELSALGLRLSDVLDFSVNTNPLGPARNVLRAIAETDWTRYPGDDEMPLRQSLASSANVSPDQIALGNGSSELIWLVALATLRHGDSVAIVSPTFGEYARAARAVGAIPVSRTSVNDLGRTEPNAPPPRLAFVCNPNNPTGAYVTPDGLHSAAASNSDCLLVVDEAYAAFTPERPPTERLVADTPNLLLLRSLTKDHALPGLRLGYLIAAPEVARAVEAVRPPWSVNAGALRAGLATLTPEAVDHVERARAVVAASRALLTLGMQRLGYQVEPSQANFIIANVGNATQLRQALLPKGVVVRDCSSFGLPEHIRIACRPESDCQRLLQAIEALPGHHN